MINILLVTSLGENPSDYYLEVAKEWVNFYSFNLYGFTPNKGQIVTSDGKKAKEVIFYTRNKNLVAYITEKGISYVIYKGDSFSRIDYELIGAKIERSNIEYYDELPGYENYYLWYCPDGILFVKSYKKVIIRNIYENIDWVFKYDEFGKLHHEFIFKKGSEISDIRIKIKNAQISIKDKEIEMKTPIGSIIDGKLVAYENEKEVQVRYKLSEDEIGFEVGKYNENLIIDPELIWSTFYGGYRDNLAYSVSIDKNNNVYVVGSTSSEEFPIYDLGGGSYFQEKKAGYENVFILKFNSNGVRLWATYYGGNKYDIPYSTSIDNHNNLYVVGYTWSTNFPIYNPNTSAYFQKSNAGDSDAFILKFSSNGIRLWATYYGGNGKDIAHSISVDKNNNIYITGYTKSDNFPIYNSVGAYFQQRSGVIDVFILKFNSKGERLWATYYGGSKVDEAYSISIDKDNNVYVVGFTLSEDFPIYNLKGAYFQEKKSESHNKDNNDAFIIKFNSKGTRLWATYYGGNGIDHATSVSIDNNNNVYVVGYTRSDNFPVYRSKEDSYFQENKAGDFDAFIVKFDSKGTRLWATYYGGNLYDGASSISIDKNNNIYVVGNTESDNFPVYNSEESSYFQEMIADDGSEGYGEIPTTGDAFILKFNSKGTRLWATYYGGNLYDGASSISIDKNNNIYVVGVTVSDAFPLYNLLEEAYFQEEEKGIFNAFILKFKSNVAK